MVRAGIQSIHLGQIEAAKSLGMTYVESMRYILPQAPRRILPPLDGQFISLIKDSSLLGIIAIRELTKATREVITTSLQPFELWYVSRLVPAFNLFVFHVRAVPGKENPSDLVILVFPPDTRPSTDGSYDAARTRPGRVRIEGKGKPVILLQGAGFFVHP
jgi:hypothetical protein